MDFHGIFHVDLEVYNGEQPTGFYQPTGFCGMILKKWMIPTEASNISSKT